MEPPHRYPKQSLPSESSDVSVIGATVPGPAIQPRSNSLITASFFILVIAALYFGREFFIPFAMATLLAFALFPIVAWLRRRRLPKGAAVSIAVVVAMATIGGLAYVVTHQVIRLADSLPRYQQSMEQKIHSFRSSTSSNNSIIDRVTSSVEGLKRELSAPRQGSAPEPVKREPIPVSIEPSSQSPIEVLKTVTGPLIGPLTTAGLVVVFLILVLLKSQDLHDRFIKLIGGANLETTTDAMNDASERVSRYLLMQLVVNILYGLPIGIGLYLIGVPNAILWGFLAAVFKFVPFLGPFLAALFPAILAFAIDPGWSMLFWVLGLLAVAELFSSNVVEPWLYGSSTGLSTLAIMSAAIFWTTLWGTVGLILATPLTVCLVVIGRYVPQLQFLGILLGSDPVLKPDEQLYQRLLAGNVEGAVEIAEAFAEEKSAQAFYDEIAIPALRLAENDRQRSAADGTYKQIVADSMIAVVRELSDHVGPKHASADLASANRLPIRALGNPHLCIGGRTDLDFAAAEMVAQVVAERGIGARVLPPISISQHGINQLDLAGVEVVCLSYLHNEPDAYVRFAARRLKKRAPCLKVVVCLWNGPALRRQTEGLAERLDADSVVFSVQDAIAKIDSFVAPHLTDPMRPAPIPENEADRLAALKALGFASGQSKEFDEIAAKVSAAFETPIALVTLIDQKNQQWPGAVGLPAKLDACRISDRESSICGHVVASNDGLVVPDVAKDPRFANNGFLIENGIRFYAGVPLRTRSGFAIGSLCILDSKPRSFSVEDEKILRKIADDVMVRVEIEHQRSTNSFAPLEGQVTPQLSVLLEKFDRS